MIFIIGGRGFVGSAFARHAEKNNIEYRVVEQDDYKQYAGQQCDILVNCNGNSKKFLANENPALEFDLSVKSVFNTIHDFKFNKYIHISSIDVYNDFSNPKKNSEKAVIDTAKQSNYGFHKYLAEQVIKKYVKNWLIIRMGGVLGAGMKKNPVFDLLNKKPLWVNINSKYQYLNTDDVAEIAFLLNKKLRKNEIINVCGNGCISLRGVAGLIDKNYKPAYAADKPRKEYYQINNSKLKSLIEAPETKDVAEKFIREYLKENAINNI